MYILEWTRALNAREASWHWVKCSWASGFRKTFCQFVEKCEVELPFSGHCLPCLLMSRAVASCVWSSLVLPPLVIPPRIFSPPVLYPPASPLLVSSWLVLPLVLFPWLQKELLGSLCGSVPSGGLWEASWSLPGGLWGAQTLENLGLAAVFAEALRPNRDFWGSRGSKPRFLRGKVAQGADY